MCGTATELVRDAQFSDIRFDECTEYTAREFDINGSLDEQTKYKYDKAGNITEVFENGILTSRYTYGLNRIVRENDKALAWKCGAL